MYFEQTCVFYFNGKVFVGSRGKTRRYISRQENVFCSKLKLFTELKGLHWVEGSDTKIDLEARRCISSKLVLFT